MKLSLTDIRRDDSAQPRAMLNTDHIKDLADALEGEVELTPVEVFHDGHSYWLADGFHRYSAYHRAKRDEIPVNVHEGDLRAAVLYSITANAKHAVLKLTRDEKRVSVTRLLRDEEWGQWSDREIARRAGVSAPTVGAIRKELPDCKTLQSDDSEPPSTLRKGADGRTINSTNIGSTPKPSPSPLPSPHPPRYPQTYSPPLTPEQPEEDDRPEYLPLRLEEIEGAGIEVLENENLDDEPLDLSAYSRPLTTSSTADIRVKPSDPSKQRPFMRAFLAAGAFNRLSDDVMVAALLSVENKTPQEQALEQEFEMAMDKMRRCMTQAETERKTVTL